MTFDPARSYIITRGGISLHDQRDRTGASLITGCIWPGEDHVPDLVPDRLPGTILEPIALSPTVARAIGQQLAWDMRRNTGSADEKVVATLETLRTGTHAHRARLLGVTRETVSHAVGRLERARRITSSRARLALVPLEHAAD